jgi:hypothetical protein
MKTLAGSGDFMSVHNSTTLHVEKVFGVKTTKLYQNTFELGCRRKRPTLLNNLNTCVI